VSNCRSSAAGPPPAKAGCPISRPPRHLHGPASCSKRSRTQSEHESKGHYQRGKDSKNIIVIERIEVAPTREQLRSPVGVGPVSRFCRTKL